MNRWMWVLVTVLLLAGCENEGEDGPTVELTTTIQKLLIEPEPWPGLVACVADSDDCDTTGSDGGATLSVPADSDVELLVTGDDEFMPHVLGFGTGTVDDEFPVNASVKSGFDLQYDKADSLLGAPVDRELGFLMLNARNAWGDTTADVAGVTATIEPDSGTQVLYSDELGLLSDDTETSSHGQIAVFGLPTGTYTVTLTHATRACTAWIAWPGDADGEVRVPIREGYVTQASAACVE